MSKIVNGGPFGFFENQIQKIQKGDHEKVASWSRDWVPTKPIILCTEKWYIDRELCGLTKNKTEKN